MLTEDDNNSLAERLRRVVTGPLHHQGTELTVGVSIGTASAAGRATLTADELLAAADTVMYREKTEARLTANRSANVSSATASRGTP